MGRKGRGRKGEWRRGEGVKHHLATLLVLFVYRNVQWSRRAFSGIDVIRSFVRVVNMSVQNQSTGKV